MTPAQQATMSNQQQFNSTRSPFLRGLYAQQNARAPQALRLGNPFTLRGPDERDMLRQMSYLAQPGVLESLQFQREMNPMQMGLVRGAFNAINPANRFGRVEQFRRDAQGQAMDMVNQNAGMLGNLDVNLMNALRIGAMNQATQAGNEFMNELYNPMADAQAAQMGAALMSPEMSNPMLGQYMDTVQARLANPRPRRTGLLGSVLGTGLQLAGAAAGLGWNPLARATGGGGSAITGGGGGGFAGFGGGSFR